MYLSMPDENLLHEIGKFSDVTHIIITKDQSLLTAVLRRKSQGKPLEKIMVSTQCGMPYAGTSKD